MQNLAIKIPSTNSTTITKRIRTTNYIVGIHFSTTAKESVSDKILRLIKSEITNKT
ncbi:MAG: transposon-encoded TnpW family protein [Defluviitaleaceae bacterium]|nr:transposon-encoded TnpW family protein [Defluviitaleaceae bacterium]